MGFPQAVAVAVTVVGNQSNANDGVATSNNNQNEIAYQYAFNGTTWDRVRSAGTTGAQAVGGTAAAGAALAGAANPVMVAGTDGTNVLLFAINTPNDAMTNAASHVLVNARHAVFNGTTWDRGRSSGVLGSTMVGGMIAAGSAIAGNPVMIGGSDGTLVRTITTDPSGRPVVAGAGTAGTPTAGVLTIQGVASMTPVQTIPGAVAAANILDGFRTDVATVAASTILTVPAGRTWVGVITITASCSKSAAATSAGTQEGVLSVSGAGATPSGSVLDVRADAGAGAATGTVGMQGGNNASIPLTIIAPGGNAVTLQAASTQTNVTVGFTSFSAIGALL